MSPAATSTSTLDTLFPAPSRPPSSQSPVRWSGIDAKSTVALLKILKDNHERWHVFFNDRGFHNHAAHHVLAIYALGASAPVIDAAYQTHVVYQRPMVPSPSAITADTFNDHLGQSEYYSGYVAFFTHVLSKDGAAATLERYVFSQKANFDPVRDAEGQTQPELLNRFVSGLLHPMIHVGYGLEFGLLGTLAEGLGQVAVHQARSTAIIPRTMFKPSQGPADTDVARLTSMMPSLALSPDATSTETPAGTHVFTIMARVLKDPSLKIKKPDMAGNFIEGVGKAHGDRILKYAEQWTLDTTNPKDVERKIEELIWMNTLIYGVGGWHKADGFQADFFLMHLVTSSLFLPSVASYLTPSSQHTFLRAYLATSILWWVIVGRPDLDIAAYYSATSARPAPPSRATSCLTPDGATLPAPASPDALTPNPWLPLLQTALVHPGEHVCKVQRALAHFAGLYGARGAGRADFGETELGGAGELDGTLFVRVAGETAGKLGWMREGEEMGRWYRDGYYDA